MRDGNFGIAQDMPASKLRLYHQLQGVAHRLQKRADRELVKAAGITAAQAAVLTIIAEGPVSQRHIAERLGFNESALTAMTGRLRKAGLIERAISASDRRAFELALSGEGRAALMRANAAFQSVNRQIDDCLGDDEQRDLAEYLQRLSAAFGK